MNQISALQLPRMTAQEFLVWPGDGTNRKFELVDGVPRPMAPARPTHGLIVHNLHVMLGAVLRSPDPVLRVMSEAAIIPGIRPEMNVNIPDIVVTRAEIDRERGDVPQPILMIEVLSPSNQRDTRRNVAGYMALYSVQEIALVHSTSVRTEVFRRDAASHWPAKPEQAGPGGRLALREAKLDAAIEEAYWGTWLLAR